MSKLDKNKAFFVDDPSGFTLGEYICDPEAITYQIPDDLDDRLDIFFDDFCYECDIDGIQVYGRLRADCLGDLPAVADHLHTQIDRLIKHLQGIGFHKAGESKGTGY